MVQPIGPQTTGTRGPGSIGEKTAGGSGFAPIIAILPRQLQSSLLQQLSGQTTAARLLSLSPGGMAQIEVRGQPMEVRLKNLPAGQSPGDTVLINFRNEDAPDDPSALTIRGGSVDRSAASRTMESLAGNPAAGSKAIEASTPSFAQQLSDTGRLLGTLSRIESRTEAAFTINVPLPEGATDIDAQANSPLRNAFTETAGRQAAATDGSAGTAGTSESASTDQAIVQYVARAMQEMSKAIENSGLFYEAHLQQWSEGQRSEDDLRNEPQAGWGPDDVLSDSITPDADEPRESTRMVAAQLGQLDRPAMHLALPGFFNDRVSLSIEPEQRRQRDSKTPPAWFATLKMELPHLGPLEMRVTLLDSQCNVLVKTSPESRSRISAGFPELMDAMAASGLQLQAQASDREATDGKS